jgi:hypothetical protein
MAVRLILSFFIIQLGIANGNSLNDCGINQNNKSIQKIIECESKNNQEKLNCLFKEYQSVIKGLENTKVVERSPLLRDFLSLNRQKFNISDEEQRILTLYETTNSYIDLKNCSEGIHQECATRPEIQSMAISDLASAKTLQSNQYALILLSRRINKLKKIIPPSLWPNRLKNTTLRNDPTPQAIIDCQQGHTPKIYPPPTYSRKNDSKPEIICPDFVALVNTTACKEVEKTTLEYEAKKLEIKNDLLNQSLTLQLEAFTAHLKTIQISSQNKKLLIETINNEASTCSDLNIDFEETESIFSKDTDYFKKRSSKTLQAIKMLGQLDKYKVFLDKELKKISTNHKQNCFYSPLNTTANYLSNKFSHDEKKQEQCYLSAQKITNFKTTIVDQIHIKINQLKTSYPGLMTPVGGIDIETNSLCPSKTAKDMINNPGTYLLFGKFGFIYRAQNMTIDHQTTSVDNECGIEAWRTFQKEKPISIPMPNSIGLNFKKENSLSYQNDLLSKTNIDQYKKSLTDAIDKIDTYAQKDITPKESVQMDGLREAINEQINQSFVKNIKLACDDPKKYSEAMLAVDKIGEELLKNKSYSVEETKIYCQIRSEFIQSEKLKEGAYLTASIGIGIIGMINPIASLIAFPIEMGIEYHQYKKHQKDQLIDMALGYLGLEDYQKINQSYDGLKNQEIILYAILSASSLGAFGDLSSLGIKITDKTNKLIKVIKRASNKNDRQILERLKEISAQNLSDSERRRLIIEAIKNHQKSAPKVTSLLTELDIQREALEQLEKKFIKDKFSDFFRYSKTPEVIPEISKIHDYELLRQIDEVVTGLSSEERLKFSKYLLRRSVCDPSNKKVSCIYLALSAYANNYGSLRAAKAKEFWKLYKNDPQFNGYLDTRLKELGIEKQYSELSEHLKEMIEDVPVNASKNESLDSQSFIDDGLDEIKTRTNPILEEATKKDPHQISPNDIKNLVDPFQEYISLNQKLIGIMDEYKTIPLTARKALPRAPPKEVKLDLTIGSGKEIKGSVIPGLTFEESNFRFLQEYERSLMSIKTGDMIRISSNGTYAPERVFKVGDFLGMGNATHVFDVTLENGKKGVLRLPGVVDQIVMSPNKHLRSGKIPTKKYKKPNGQFYSQSGPKTPRRKVNFKDKEFVSWNVNRRYIEKYPQVQCTKKIELKHGLPCFYTVKIIESDPNYRFVISEKINNIQFDGTEFLKDPLVKTIEDLFFKRKLPKNDIAQRLGKSTLEVQEILDKHKNLHNSITMAKKMGVSDLHQGQFIYAKRPDNGEMDWILADW